MHRDDPAAMSVDEGLDEVAALLAAGFLRLKRRTGCLPLTQRVPQRGTGRAAVYERRSNRGVKGPPPLVSPGPEHGRPRRRRTSNRDIREREKFENPGGLALPSFGKPGPLCRALAERVSAERTPSTREAERSA